MAYTVDNSIGGATMITWDPITGAVGETAVQTGGIAGMAGAVQVIGGTPGSVALQGSLDGTNWAALKDPQGGVIALTALGAYAEFSSAARFIRPLGNAGSAAAVVRVIIRP